MRRLQKGIVAGIAGAALVALAAACSGDAPAAATPAAKATTPAAAATTPAAAATTPAAATPTAARAAATQTAAPAAAAAAPVGVTLSEMKIEANPAKARAGSLTFNVKNGGAIPHELVVFKSDAAADALPQRAGQVDETAVTKAADTNEFPGGETKPLTANLTAGKYVLACNVAGHYAAGMRIAFTVE